MPPGPEHALPSGPRHKSSRLGLLERLFAGALERPAGSARKRWLQNASGNDETLVAEVASLLEAHQAAEGFLESGAVVQSVEPAELEPVHVGSGVGPYTLVEELGEGGFGVVFRALQSTPIRREVALKVIKLGMDTRQVIARFEAERRALALLDHPSIARVLDAGATDRGRPYFVMDLAPGQPITEYCDELQLTTKERLRVFIELCSAMQHAHQRGVIHRDIKPSNVLVADAGGRALPKVIDFGIAKATGAEFGTGTLFTEMGQVIGTPVYMSPEQAIGSSDIDIRSDVYSLGVVLHELLVGETPFHAEELRQHVNGGDIAAFLAETTPAPLSGRVSVGDQDAADVARCRRTTPAELARLLRGDLENILHCALAPERERRYESAAAFARDLERLLSDRPIEATPPSVAYRAAKLLRRHRVAALASAAVLVALIAGLAVAFQSLTARQAQAELLREIFSTARFEDLYDATAADQQTPPDELDRLVIGAFGERDPIRVDALETLADRLVTSGRLAEGVEAQTAALAAARQIHGAGSAQATRQQAALGLLLARRGDPLLAEFELGAALAAERLLTGPVTTALHSARLELADLLEDSGQREAAIVLLEEADQIAASVETGDGARRIEALEALASLSRRNDDTAATRGIYTRLLELYERRYAQDSAFLVTKYVEYGRWLASVGLTEEASLPMDLALDALDRTAAPPVGLLFETLSALNRLYAQDPSLTTDSEARASLNREVLVASERFSGDATEYLDTLARCAEDLERRGALGRSTQLLTERFVRFEALTGENQLAEATQRARITLAEELLDRADAIRRQGGLPVETYRAARQAAEHVTPYFPGNRNLLEIRLVLATRTGEFAAMLGLLNEFEAASGAQGVHPLALAMQAIALHQTPGSQRAARRALSQAQELARRPEFISLPGLQEAVEWAAEAIYGER
ncbi:MAG: protein kinase [Planctomycetota bacterium]|nr:protein kinase [Planctomycetota bacterium]